MDIQEIKQKVLQVYQDCMIRTFPLSCTSILEHYHFKVYSYSYLKSKNTELYEICKKYSNDAFTYSNLICYNDTMPIERIRFSLMHELGHAILATSNETLANQFASHILLPRTILNRSNLTDIKDIRSLFFTSKEAAAYALQDIQLKPDECMTGIDLKIQEHFYNPEKKIIIYHESECPICGNTIYNSIKDTCIYCKKLSKKSR